MEQNCTTCRYRESNKTTGMPCRHCSLNYVNQWQPIEDTTPIDFGCGEDGCEIDFG